MVSSISLYVALAIFGIGLLYTVSRWFRYSISIGTGGISVSRRLIAAFRGIISILLSAKIIALARVFFLDVVLNVRIAREDFLRWLMHVCIYWGFVLLIVTHALGTYTGPVVVEEYYSTINPFLFLRDLFGALVIFGVAIAIYRRFILKIPSLMTKRMDLYALIIVAVIILSGIFLQGTQIVSYKMYNQMVEGYTVLEDEQESKALEAYWVQEFGVVSPAVKGPFDEETLVQGRELHSASCSGCHSKAQWAFTSYGISKALRPVARGLDRANAHVMLWYVHFFACLIGLAYLPFSKMFHVIASPLSLLANAVMKRAASAPANRATRQMMELDACTHCGTCTSRCSVAAALAEIPNSNILPSEKILAIRALASGRELQKQEIKAIQEGVYLCTNCYRCTVVCPVGINLQELWFDVREVLLQRGLPEFSLLSPLSFYRGLMRGEVGRRDYKRPLARSRKAIADKCDLMKRPDKVVPLVPADRVFKNRLRLSAQASTFSVCFGCQTCTNACPVVANYENPQEVLGMLPHQIMRACALGVKDLAFGSNMLWDCLTCYQCQEQCPQGVGVTDVLYELKNLAVEYVSGRSSQPKEKSQ